MIYNYTKYKDISDFVNNIPKTSIQEEYTILNKCNGCNFPGMTFNNKCFGCLFCLSNTSQTKKAFDSFWGAHWLENYAREVFRSNLVKMPLAKQTLRNPMPSLCEFTATNETSHIQPWAAGLVNNIGTRKTRVGMEVPVFNEDYDRNGRLDVCAIIGKRLLAIETKTCLDDALKDERFVEQQSKYIDKISEATTDFRYLTLFGGKETDLLPESHPLCSGKSGKKTQRFYSIVTKNNIKFLSAPALWCVACLFIANGEKYAWDTFLFDIFQDNRCLGLLSAGKVVSDNELITIEPLF